jgi:hypothetical protein
MNLNRVALALGLFLAPGHLHPSAKFQRIAPGKRAASEKTKTQRIKYINVVEKNTHKITIKPVHHYSAH